MIYQMVSFPMTFSDP